MTNLNWWNQKGDIKLPELKNDKNNNIKKLSKTEIENIVNDKKIDDFEKISLLYWPYLNKEDFIIFKKVFDTYKDSYKEKTIWKFPIYVLLWIKNNYIKDEVTKICIDRRLECIDIYEDTYQNYLIENNLDEEECSIEEYVERMDLSYDDADAITLCILNDKYKCKIYDLLINNKLNTLSSREILIEILKSWNCIIDLKDVAYEALEDIFEFLSDTDDYNSPLINLYSPLLTNSKEILEKYWINIDEDIFKTINDNELEWYFKAEFWWNSFE